VNREAAERHLTKVASRHGILIHWRRRAWAKFEAHIETKMVWIGKPTSAIRYLGALHEMGHIVSKVARDANKREHALTEEAAAWDWALGAADPRLVGEIRPEDRSQLALAWASYFSVE
jgi:hypothetical protein